jgi:hypothetical protein
MEFPRAGNLEDIRTGEHDSLTNSYHLLYELLRTCNHMIGNTNHNASILLTCSLA